MNDFLQRIIEEKKQLVVAKKDYYATIKSNLDKTLYTRYRLFHRRLTRSDDIQLIAEIKKASPSKGLIRENFDPIAIARIYAKANVAAISVLTEEKFFLGKPAYIKNISEAIETPLLTKDFIIDEGQIYEARVLGASAVLLIVAILSDEQLMHLMDVAERLDMDCLVEVHDQKELERAIKAGADIIGINNRDLRTFDVKLETSINLIPRIPNHCVIVAESGIETHEHVSQLKSAGAHAVLIGETFMRSHDIDQQIKDVMYGKS